MRMRVQVVLGVTLLFVTPGNEATLTATVLHAMATYFHLSFLGNRKFTRVYGFYSDVEAGRLKDFSPLGHSVCELWYDWPVDWLQERPKQLPHEQLGQERAPSCPRVSWELAATPASSQ